MKIQRLHIQNYRTLVDIKLEFPSFYSAICGRNDCGKTNVVRAIRGLMKEDQPFDVPDKQKFSLKKDFPKWLELDADNSRISIIVDLLIHFERDAGLYDFILTYLSLEFSEPELSLTIKIEFGAKESDQNVSVSVGDDSFKAIKCHESLLSP